MRSAALLLALLLALVLLAATQQAASASYWIDTHANSKGNAYWSGPAPHPTTTNKNQWNAPKPVAYTSKPATRSSKPCNTPKPSSSSSHKGTMSLTFSPSGWDGYVPGNLVPSKSDTPVSVTSKPKPKITPKTASKPTATPKHARPPSQNDVDMDGVDMDDADTTLASVTPAPTSKSPAAQDELLTPAPTATIEHTNSASTSSTPVATTVTPVTTPMPTLATLSPFMAPTEEPTMTPPAASTLTPITSVPTPQPTAAMPTSQPTTVAPTLPPSTTAPTSEPTTASPSYEPITVTPTPPPPTTAPTTAPTAAPTLPPTTAAPTPSAPTLMPTLPPSNTAPTTAPTPETTTAAPTSVPITVAPTLPPLPTVAPTAAPTAEPTTAAPTTAPIPVSTLPASNWPIATAVVQLSAPLVIRAGDVFDGAMNKYERSNVRCDEAKELAADDVVFIVHAGGTLQNVIIGAHQVAGVLCVEHKCALTNVWSDAVCQAALVVATGAGLTTVTGGGAKNATSRVILAKSAGTVTVSGGFYLNNCGPLFESCATCGPVKRQVVVDGVVVVNPTAELVRVNRNYKDEATIVHATIDTAAAAAADYTVCTHYDGGKVPTLVGAGVNGTLCQYNTTGVTIVRV